MDSSLEEKADGNSDRESVVSTDSYVPLQSVPPLYVSFVAAGSKDALTHNEYLDFLCKHSATGLVTPAVDFWQNRHEYGMQPTLPHPCIPDNLSSEAAWSLTDQTGFLYSFSQQTVGNQTIAGHPYIHDTTRKTTNGIPMGIV